VRPSELLAELHDERQRQWALQDKFMAEATAQICREMREAREAGRVVVPLDRRDDDQKDYDEEREGSTR